MPGVPNLLQIVRSTGNSTTLSWFAPMTDVGSPEVKKYRIYRQTLPVEHWEECGTSRSTTFTVPGLREGKQYVFGVRAENEVGMGEMVSTDRPLHIRKTVGECTDTSSLYLYVHFTSDHCKDQFSIVVKCN